MSTRKSNAEPSRVQNRGNGQQQRQPQQQVQYQEYYSETDYKDVLNKLPSLIRDATKRAAMALVPTLNEKNEIKKIIKQLMAERKRIVYGGDALNEALKHANHDGIYGPYDFYDVEFYSPTPVRDVTDICNELYRKGYKNVTASEAQHAETYKIFVNSQEYCDVTYVPNRIFRGIKTLIIGGVIYVHPHFALIDYLRMFNQPLTAAEQRWEKAFKRFYALISTYPLRYFENKPGYPHPDKSIQAIVNKINNEFFSLDSNFDKCLAGGFFALNYFLNYAITYDPKTGRRNNSTGRKGEPDVHERLINSSIEEPPFAEIYSVDYKDTVVQFYDYLKGIVDDANGITLEEHWPLFQLTGHSTYFSYKGAIVAKILSADGYCVPSIKENLNGKSRISYVSFQYLLQTLLTNRFTAHVDTAPTWYNVYDRAISVLIVAKNYLLAKDSKMSVINNTIFTEFKIDCIGTTLDYRQESGIRRTEKFKKGGFFFKYTPEAYFAATPDVQQKQPKPEILDRKFKNTSGNPVTKPSSMLFKFRDEDGIRTLYYNEEAGEEAGEEPDIEEMVEEAEPNKNTTEGSASSDKTEQARVKNLNDFDDLMDSDGEYEEAEWDVEELEGGQSDEISDKTPSEEKLDDILEDFVEDDFPDF
jgi:hypothetical protein